MTKLKTNPQIQQIINSGIANYLKNQQTVIDHPQSQLGWRSFLMGYYHSTFITDQTDHAIRNKTKGTGSSWAVSLRNFIWTELHQLWLSRCEALHNPDDEFPFDAQREKLIARIRKIYEYKTKVSVDDQKIVDLPIDERLALPTLTLAIWTPLAEKAIHRAAKDFADRHRTSTQDIRTFLVRKKTTPKRNRIRVPRQVHPE